MEKNIVDELLAKIEENNKELEKSKEYYEKELELVNRK